MALVGIMAMIRTQSEFQGESFPMTQSNPPRFRLVSSSVPPALAAVLNDRDWEALIQMLADGFPANASWGSGGSLFERFALAASVPAPPVSGSREQALQLRVVQAFLEAGLSPHANPRVHLPLSVAALAGRPDFVDALLAGAHAPDGLGGKVSTPLGALAMRRRAGLEAMGISHERHVACVQELLRGGADVNFPGPGGWVPLNLAASLGDHDMVRVLLKHGALVNARAPGIPQNPGPHYAPVCWAVHRDDATLLDILLRAGAALAAPMEQGINVVATAGARSGTDVLTVLARKKGLGSLAMRRAWFQAIANDRRIQTLWFLAAGASATRINEEGWTPLDVACQHHALSVIPLLHAAGANPHRHAIDGMSPLARLRVVGGDKALAQAGWKVGLA